MEEKNLFENSVSGPAEEISEVQEPEKKKKSLKSEIFDWGKTLLFYCVIPLLIFQALGFMANVPTGSMTPTIPRGAQVITTRMFNTDNVKRGDIIVFDSDELGLVLIKRCIGLPGDSVVFDGTGDVYVNGEKLYEPYLGSDSDFEGSFEVPEDCYFFVGDNRGGSLDARYWDEPYIHADKIKGKARFVLFPVSDFGFLE